MNKSQIDRVEAMLAALLKSDNLIEWVGSYAYGRTSTGDPYITLFPESDKLENKVCRVYPRQFKKLKGLCDTDVPESVRRSKTGPTKAQAKPTHKSFQVLMTRGKDTQMGREKRFECVLRTWDRPKPTAPQAPPTAPVDDKVAFCDVIQPLIDEGLYDNCDAVLKAFNEKHDLSWPANVLMPRGKVADLLTTMRAAADEIPFG